MSVGHLQANWGSDYGFNGCISDLVIDGLAPLVMADVKENTGTTPQAPVKHVNVKHVNVKHVNVKHVCMYSTCA